MLGKRGIWRRRHLGLERRRRLRPHESCPAGTWHAGHGARLALHLSPAFDRTQSNTEEAGRLGLREPGVNGSQQPLAEVGGVLLHPAILPPVRLIRNPL